MSVDDHSSAGHEWLYPPGDGVKPGDVAAVLVQVRELIETGPAIGSAADAVEHLEQFEELSRLAEAGQLRLLQTLERSRVYFDHGYRSAAAMAAAHGDHSGPTKSARDKTRRMLDDCDEIADSFFDGGLGVDQVRVLARAYSNRRVRHQFIDDQSRFLGWADRLSFKRFKRKIADWVSLTDADGADPNNPAHERRNASIVQDYFSRAWQLKANFGAEAGAEVETILRAYIKAEFESDWAIAKEEHGDSVCRDLLHRDDAQRRADAMHQICLDAAANPASSMPAATVHHVRWSAETFFETARRHFGGDARPHDIDTYCCETFDGKPLNPAEAFANAMVNEVRRVIVEADSVTIDMGDKVKLFTGDARIAGQIPFDECEWRGCHVPVTECQADHIRARAIGGPTDQINNVPLCGYHNRLKELGYTVWRDPDTKQVHIITPKGDQIQ